MGGGVASAVARALGGGRRAEARTCWPCTPSVIALGDGRGLHGRGSCSAVPRSTGHGREGAALAAAVTYSQRRVRRRRRVLALQHRGIVVRGTGVDGTAAGAWRSAPRAVRPCPRPGPRVGTVPAPRRGRHRHGQRHLVRPRDLVLLGYLVSGRGLVRLSLAGVRFRGRLFREILRVGAPGSLNTVLTNLTIVLSPGSWLRSAPLPWPATASPPAWSTCRSPSCSASGRRSSPMVGTNSGAGQDARAERVAWTGAGLAGGCHRRHRPGGRRVPRRLDRLFTTDPEVMAAGADLPADRRPHVRLLRARAGALLRLAGRRPARVASRRGRAAPHDRGAGGAVAGTSWAWARWASSAAWRSPSSSSAALSPPRSAPAPGGAPPAP